MPNPARAYTDLLARLTASKPPRIALQPKPEDFSACARHIGDVISACRDYLVRLIIYADENEQGSSIADADLIGSIHAHLADLAGEAAGTLEQLAQRMIGERSGSTVSRRCW